MLTDNDQRVEGSQAEALNLINKAKTITIICHINPDGDAIGSMLALAQGLRKLGKHCSAISPDQLSAALSFLPGFSDIISCPPELAKPDLIIALDSSDTGRLGAPYAANTQLFQAVPVLNIDHHVSNGFYGTVNWVDTEAAAVAEPVYQLLVALGVDLDLPIATNLLTALVTDTHCFRTSNTKPRTLTIASHLMSLGAPLAEIVDWVYNTKKLSTLQLWVKVLSTVETSAGVIWAEVTDQMLAEAGAQRDESDDLVNLIAGIREAKVALLFRQNGNDGVRVSMRSNGEVNVADVASHFGGGGHPRAAGCGFAGTMAEAKETLLTYLKRYAMNAAKNSPANESTATDSAAIKSAALR